MHPDFARKIARMKVVPRPDGSFHVGGDHGIYTVRFVDGATFCTCIASRNGVVCTHKYAVNHYQQQQKETS